jgi:hypothetical protein
MVEYWHHRCQPLREIEVVKQRKAVVTDEEEARAEGDAVFSPRRQATHFVVYLSTDERTAK